MALDQTAEDRSLLGQIADASGGDVVEAADPAALKSVFTAQADALASQVLVRFHQPERAAEEANLAVSLATDGATYRDSAFVSLAEVTDGGPSVVEVGSPLVGRAVMFVGAAALGLALAAVLAVVLVGYRGKSHSRAGDLRLPRRGAARSRRQRRNAGPRSLKDSAVALTSNFVKGDFETRLAQRLAAAGLGLTAAEWVLLHAGVAFAGGLVGLVLGGGVLMVILLVARRRGPVGLPQAQARPSAPGLLGAASGDAVTHRGRTLGGPVDARRPSTPWCVRATSRWPAS